MRPPVGNERQAVPMHLICSTDYFGAVFAVVRGRFAIALAFLAFFLLVHFFVSNQICVGMACVVEAAYQLVLLAGWGKISHEASGREGGRFLIRKKLLPRKRFPIGWWR